MKIKTISTLAGISCVFFFIFTGMIHAQTVRYHNFSDMESELKALSKTYPQLIRPESQGKTPEGRSIWSVTLGAGATDSRPAVLMVAGADATDLAGTEVLLQFVASAARDYGKVDSITTMLDETVFYIFPRVNPDASEALFSKPVYARTLNARSMDLDNDGKNDEDGYDDLNKDGQITWMRINEPGGEWMDDEAYPGLLRKADAGKNEAGMYRLLREGYDNDGDGAINEDEPGGVDFNRNFTYHYAFFEVGSGYHQISEVESRAVADFAFAHPNITAVFTFSPNDNLNMVWEAAKGPVIAKNRGERKPVEQVDEKDAPYYAYVSEQYKIITGRTDFLGSEAGKGAFNEWAYYHFGRWSFSTPAWWPPLSRPEDDTTSVKTDDMKKEKRKKHALSAVEVKNDASGMKPHEVREKSRDQRQMDWLRATGQQDAFLPWTAIKHPDFPDKKVEIGGFKPFAAANPPADSLPGMAEAYSRFFYGLSRWLPRLDVKKLKVEDLHDNLYRISLSVVNNGYLPTNTRIGIENQWCPELKLALELSAGQKLVSGRVLQFIDRLEGSGGSEEVSWMVLGKRGETLKIQIGNPMTGIIVKKIEL